MRSRYDVNGKLVLYALKCKHAFTSFYKGHLFVDTVTVTVTVFILVNSFWNHYSHMLLQALSWCLILHVPLIILQEFSRFPARKLSLIW